MKTLDVPSSGKRGNTIASRNHSGPYVRGVGAAPGAGSAAQVQWRGTFGPISASWGKALTMEQRTGWRRLAKETPSRVRLGKSHSVTGQNCYVAVNSVLARLARERVLDAPELAAFSANPVGGLKLSRGEEGVTLKLGVAGPVVEEIMVYGAPPCSAGREKPAYVKFLGLLGAAEAGAWDVTRMYVDEFGELAPGMQVFICTRQVLRGQEGDDHLVSEIVPAR